MERYLIKNYRKVFVSYVLVFIVFFSVLNFTPEATIKAIKSPSSFNTPKQAAQKLLTRPSNLDINLPSTEYFDYENGTTRMVIDYQNGTKDVISETMQTRTAKLELEPETATQSMAVTTPTSVGAESEQNRTTRADSRATTTSTESAEWITVTQDAVMEQEVLMGFTYQLVAERWTIVDVGFDIEVLEAYARAGIEVDIGFGLRLPIRIALEYPDVMTVEHDYECYATLTPLNLPDFDEFKCSFIACIWIEAGIWAPIVGWIEYSETFGPNYDFSKSFTTPLGSGMSFPISALEITVWDLWLMAVKVVIEPQLGSDKITAKASASGDATGDQTITWSAPGQKKPFTVHASDYGSTDFAKIQLSDFRYYFSIFKLHFKLKFDFDGWIDWLTGDPTISIFTLDMSWLTDGLYLGVHQGTDGTVDVDVFVKKFGVDLIVTPFSQGIIPGYIGTYNVLVINKGNVQDTFILSIAGLPGTWWSELSTTTITVPAYGSTSVQLSVQPYRHWSTSPGDYPFTISGASQQAPLHDLTATDTDNVVVQVLPFYEVDILITPETCMTEPGGTEVYTIEVTNLGNVLDSFDISLYFNDFDGSYRAVPTAIQPEWITIDKTSMTMGPGISDIATLSITVPSDWEGMENAIYEFIATAISTTTSTASDNDISEFMVQATKESKTRYINLELDALIDMVSSSTIYKGIKNSLLAKFASASHKKEQALDYVIEGRTKQANNMLKAVQGILNAYINQAEAQCGKYIPKDIADTWSAIAQTIVQDIEVTIMTPG